MKTILQLLLLLALVPSAVLADDDEEGEYAGQERARLLQPAKVNPTWAKECSACHIAYAPGLLPVESWRKLMSGLDKHFKADASLSAKENQEITAFLVANAANRWTGNAAPMRITETQWFKSQHNGREVAAEVWNRASVRSASNCQACHAGADRGDFSERSVKIPR